jgi:hypothetical protein
MHVLLRFLLDFPLFSKMSITKVIQHRGVTLGFIYSAVKGLKKRDVMSTF